MFINDEYQSIIEKNRIVLKIKLVNYNQINEAIIIIIK